MGNQDAQAQRTELHRTIWRIANDLRGSVDGWDFKAYVLGMLFYRFISDNLCDYIDADERRAGNPEFSYAELDDQTAERGMKETIREKGFFIFPSQLFENVRKRAHTNPNLNEELHNIFRSIELSARGTASEGDLEGLFADFDTSSPKLGSTVPARSARLAQLMDAIAEMPIGRLGSASIDVFGDAYEFLMRMYASQAGKSGGEFFTPQEVSEVLARLAVDGRTHLDSAYDPAVGSASLLLQFLKILGHDNVDNFYGQEINVTSYNLARINMFLHEINFEKFDIALGDTLLEPAHDPRNGFAAIVSNPPYSTHWEGKNNPRLIHDERFSPAGVLAPVSAADLAFTMHILHNLAVDGTAAVLQFPGVLYRSGAEAKIRQYLVDNNYVQAVIQLPLDLFFGTGIQTCIIVLKKSKTDSKVLFMDASAQFERIGSKNTLQPRHRDYIVDTVQARETISHVTALVSNDDIAAKDYSLSISSYVEPEDTREIIDITELNAKIQQIVAKQQILRTEIDQIVSELQKDSERRPERPEQRSTDGYIATIPSETNSDVSANAVSDGLTVETSTGKTEL